MSVPEFKKMLGLDPLVTVNILAHGKLYSLMLHSLSFSREYYKITCTHWLMDVSFLFIHDLLLGFLVYIDIDKSFEIWCLGINLFM